jgi:L-threonate 2-dehydrogenase
MTRTGIVGLGLMGRAFAARMVKSGHEVLGYDVDSRRCEDFGRAKTRSNVRELGDECDVLILSVFDTPQVEEVIFGHNGIFGEGTRKAYPIIICTSTCDPDQIEALAARCKEVGMRFLELPFSGTSLQVERGEGVGLMGGDSELAKEVSPLLDVLCPRRQFVGDGGGDANRAKLAVNLVLGLHRAALAEGLNFGARLGLDPAGLLHLLQNSAASSSVMKVKGPLMVRRKYDEPQSRVDQSLKDFALIQDQSLKAGQKLPLTDIYVKLLQSCTAHGEGQLDNAVIFEAIARSEF